MQKQFFGIINPNDNWYKNLKVNEQEWQTLINTGNAKTNTETDTLNAKNASQNNM